MRLEWPARLENLATKYLHENIPCAEKEHPCAPRGPRDPGLLPRARRRARRIVGEQPHTSGYTNQYTSRHTNVSDFAGILVAKLREVTAQVARSALILVGLLALR